MSQANSLEERIELSQEDREAFNPNQRVYVEYLEGVVKTDFLTGIGNRRGFDEHIDSEISRTNRTERPVSILMIDLDWFKQYNDSYGHDEGDELLKLVAKSFSLRKIDRLYRWGGDEFAAVLPETETNGAVKAAERFKECFDENFKKHVKERGLKGDIIVTLSIGIASYRDGCNNKDDLIKHADQALYSAKSERRSSERRSGICVYQPI